MALIRSASLNDLESLLKLEQNFPGDKLSKRSFQHFITKGHADVLVFESDNELLADAVLLYRKGSSSARLYSLVVAPQARGKGLARDLLESCEKTAELKGCTHMHLEVRKDNLAAIRLYEQNGYQIFKQIDAYYEDGATALKMGKSL